ncbi:polysaccharide deacetylase family protein [Lentisphaera profundi]|uniref:Polysaccharide deacetylase family protein n=1 Tax=Lentisphaera profundi TaxID=1658616 RepID=A0ABY7VVL7_9BACT|nr:polysaccharide deacetylase family protein [Lentisphaera profundi]WDE97328.1 polysaccharide deacetylase family protein [Lentisphaera profundi]
MRKNKLKISVFMMTVLSLVLPAEDSEKTVVLTFDDSVKSQAEFVAPLLKKHGFNATFFITEGFSFHKRKDLYMTWAQIKQLHDQGFEIGNHTKSHRSVKKMSAEQLRKSLEHIENQCKKHGIPKPISFCYPGYATAPKALKVLQEKGYRFARAGGDKASEVAKDNLLLLPQAFDAKPKSTLEQFKKAVDQADAKHIPILTFHGVPDLEHPWVTTSPEKFKAYMKYLKDNDFKVISLRDYPLKN